MAMEEARLCVGRIDYPTNKSWKDERSCVNIAVVIIQLFSFIFAKFMARYPEICFLNE